MKLSAAITYAYGFSQVRTLLPELLGETLYDFEVNLPRHWAGELNAELQRAIEAAFGLRSRREMREMDAYLLLAPQGKAAVLIESTRPGGMIRYEKGRILSTAMSLRRLSSLLEGILSQPVLDQTELIERFDFTLEWDAERPESLMEAIRDQLGLELRPARRPIEILIMETVEPPAPKPPVAELP